MTINNLITLQVTNTTEELTKANNMTTPELLSYVKSKEGKVASEVVLLLCARLTYYYESCLYG